MLGSWHKLVSLGNGYSAAIIFKHLAMHLRLCHVNVKYATYYFGDEIHQQYDLLPHCLTQNAIYILPLFAALNTKENGASSIHINVAGS